MSDLAGALGNFGPLRVFVDPETGANYPIRYLDEHAKAAFSQWLKDRALRTLQTLQPILGGEAFDKAVKQYQEDSVLGRFDFWGEVSEQARATVVGSFKLASILMDRPEAEVIALGARCGDLLTPLLETVVRESMPTSKRRPRASAEGEGEGPEGNGPRPG